MSISVPAPCSKCHAECNEVCQMCHGPMCPDHTSQIDPIYCSVCVSVEPTCIGITESPLRDDENVTHEGRLIHPTGEAYRTIPSAIAEMSDEDLTAYLDKMKMLVKQAESTLEYRRIALGTATLEQDGRVQAARRRLRGIKVVSAGSRVISANAKGPAVGASATKMAGIVEALKTIDPTQLAALMAAIKAKQASTPKIVTPSQTPKAAVSEPQVTVPPTGVAEPPVVRPASEVEQVSPAASPVEESEFDKILREEQERERNGN